MKLSIIGMLLMTLAVSGCALSGVTTGPLQIEPPINPQNGKDQARLSLCEILDREELLYSPDDTEESKRQWGGVIEKYDATC